MSNIVERLLKILRGDFMKKSIFVILLILTVFVSGCGMKTNTETPEYFGNFKDEPLYKEIINIENCTVPEQLVSILEGLYGETISYIFLEYDEEKETFKEPYEDFRFNVYSVYSKMKNKGNILTDSYAFFLEYNESPVFIMDEAGSYLVGNYEIETVEENSYIHYVDAWAVSDLYLCLHGYANCEGDMLRREAYTNIVKSLDCYINLESRIISNTSDVVRDMPSDNAEKEYSTNTQEESKSHEEYVQTYYASALEGAVITWQDNSTGEFKYVSKCMYCGRTGSTTCSGRLTSGCMNSGFVCSNSKCHMQGKSQQIQIKTEVSGEWVIIYD